MSKQFSWVPDGIYDHRVFFVRYKVANGGAVTVISKMWLDKGGPEEIGQEMLVPWGTYPDFPPKPKKV